MQEAATIYAGFGEHRGNLFPRSVRAFVYIALRRVCTSKDTAELAVDGDYVVAEGKKTKTRQAAVRIACSRALAFLQAQPSPKRRRMRRIRD